jgi:hypothetical protein
VVKLNHNSSASNSKGSAQIGQTTYFNGCVSAMQR